MLSSFRWQGLRISFLTLLTFFMLCLYLPSVAMVYYIDEKGVVHFVEDETMIPEKYKNQKKVIESIKKDDSGADGRDIKPVEKKLTEPQKELVKDRFGNTPAYWRQRYKTLQTEKLSKERELRSLEEQRDELAKRYESARSRAFYIGDSQSVTEAASLELKLKDTENMIKMTVQQLDELNKKISVDIYDELLQAGGNPSWLLSEE